MTGAGADIVGNEDVGWRQLNDGSERVNVPEQVNSIQRAIEMLNVCKRGGRGEGG